MHPVAATLLGYTHEEMHENFKKNIQFHADSHNVSYDVIFEKLVFQYDGYRFASNPKRVFNPVSIANVFTSQEFKNYWFATANPSWLIPYMKTKPFFYTGKVTTTDSS